MSFCKTSCTQFQRKRLNKSQKRTANIHRLSKLCKEVIHQPVSIKPQLQDVADKIEFIVDYLCFSFNL